MAYLNVRERRMETRIAYVGPLGVGKAANLEQLGLRAKPSARPATRPNDGAGDVLSLMWSPDAAFREYPIAVEVLAARGAEPGHTSQLVRDADAVVLVLDASPDAEPRNRAAVALVRDALVSEDVPVVVQVNKTDVTDARAPGTIVGELGIVWPHVVAAAARGEGVLETLERTIEQLRAHLEASPQEPLVEGAAAKTPLLSALTEVLTETMNRRARALEDTFAARVLAARAEDTAAIVSLGRLVASEAESTRAALASLRERTEAMEKVAHELSSRVANGTDDTLRGLATHTTALAAHAGALTALEQKVGDPRTIEQSLDALKVGNQRRSEELAAKIERKHEELRAELLRAVESRARTDRELILSSVVALKGVVEGVSQDVKQADVRGPVTDLGRVLADVRAKVEALTPLLTTVKDVHRVLRDEVGAAVVARFAKVEEHMRTLGQAHQEAAQKSEERQTELGERVKELGVAMKAKKSWFT